MQTWRKSLTKRGSFRNTQLLIEKFSSTTAGASGRANSVSPLFLPRSPEFFSGDKMSLKPIYKAQNSSCEICRLTPEKSLANLQMCLSNYIGHCKNICDAPYVGGQRTSHWICKNGSTGSGIASTALDRSDLETWVSTEAQKNCVTHGTG